MTSHTNNRFPDTYSEDFHNTEDVCKMKYNKFGDTGLEISDLSYGGAAIGGVFRSANEQESHEVVKYLIRSGINYIDTSPWYGNGKSEKVLGSILPSIPRNTYYLATKVGRYEPQVEKMFDFRAERVLSSIDESLQRLGQDYVDVLQVHDFEYAPSIDMIINETLPALQKVKNAGKTRFIGITSLSLEKMRTVIERSTVKIDTVLSFCRGYMPDTSLRDYLPYFKEKGVGVINASASGMGMLTERGPPKWHPAQKEIKEACANAAIYCKEKGVDISRLSLSFSMNQGTSTTMFSTASLTEASRSLDVVHTPLTDLEKQVSADIIAKYMVPLNNMNWEGICESQYEDELKGTKTSFLLDLVKHKKS